MGVLAAGIVSLHSVRALAQSDNGSPAITHHTDWAPMRDGVLLASEVYLPKEIHGRLPVVLMRSPYNGGMPVPSKSLPSLVAQGYVVVNQDCRGTGRSHGVFRPIIQEQADGYDAVEWAAAQPWSDGKVGLWGPSYLGLTVMQAAIMHPPHLVAAIAMITGSDYHDNWTYANGVFDLWFDLSWVSMRIDNDVFGRQLMRSGIPWFQVQERIKQGKPQSDRNTLDRPKRVPLSGLPEMATAAPFYDEWLSHPSYDRFWSDVDLERRYGDIKVPVLLTGGWYDIFSVGTVRNFQGLRSHGGSAVAREQSKLVMEPTCHGNCNETLKFDADRFYTQLNSRWWDYWLKGIDTGIAREPVVKLFVMVPPQSGDHDAGFWTSAAEYPLPGTKRARFYLASRGHANSRRGDGVLRTELSATAKSDQFVYDPHNPVPTLGGNLCCGDLLRPGVFDQSEVELRDDILIYSSEPLTQDLTVIGPVAVEFWAASSAPDTDFSAKLVAVRPDGVAYNILDRIINTRLRRGSKLPPEPAVAGRPYHYRLELGDTAVLLKPGFRVRLEISSSNFPHFARNPNTGRPRATEHEFRKATQIVTHDAQYPSFLELPLATPVQH